MVTIGFLEEVMTAFRPMIDSKKLAIMWSIYDTSPRGPAAMTLVGGNVLLRIVRQARQVDVYIACVDEPDEWSPLQQVVRSVEGPAAPPLPGIDLAQAALIVDAYFPRLQHGCAPGRAGGVTATRSS